MTKILLVNHSLSKYCGIYSHGVRMGKILSKSKKYKFNYCECNSIEDLKLNINLFSPSIIIYNYTNGLMGWANNSKNIFSNILHLGMIHDVTPEQMVDSNISPFDFRICLDPTLKERDRWFTTVRPLLGYKGRFSSVRNEIPTIGSFGFYFPHKNFGNLIQLIKTQLNKAIINLHITKAFFSSENVKNEMDMFILWANQYVSGTDIKINITTNYISDDEQIDFLSKNDLNILNYSGNYGSGPSSAIDYCVASGRPIMISDSYQFRHIINRLPSVKSTSILSAIEQGNSEVLKLRDEWSEENFIKDYERIINEVQNRKR